MVSLSLSLFFCRSFLTCFIVITSRCLCLALMEAVLIFALLLTMSLTQVDVEMHKFANKREKKIEIGCTFWKISVLRGCETKTRVDVWRR
jgi:hypothetical protein